jgi:hypothetical protein
MRLVGDGAAGTGDPLSSTFAPKTLQEMGIGPSESHRWQRIASIPDEAFADYLSECVSQRKEITTAGALALARRCEREQADEEDSERIAQRNSDYAAFERSAKFVRELLWLDPKRVVEQMPAEHRSKVLEDIRRWMTWMLEARTSLLDSKSSAGVVSDQSFSAETRAAQTIRTL